jgi:hypothetical protein
VHALAFDQPVSVYEGAARRGKAWDEWQAEHGDGLVLTASELAKAMPIVDALRADPIAGPLLFSGERMTMHAQRFAAACHSSPPPRNRECR